MPKTHPNPAKKIVSTSYRMFSSKFVWEETVFFRKLKQELSEETKSREKLWLFKDYFKKNYPKTYNVNCFNEHHKTLLFRGSEGLSELEFMLETNHLGKQLLKNLSKKNSLDLARHIDTNDVKNYLSFTDCAKTALTYSTKLNFVPGLGVVFITGYPEVFINPRHTLKINRQMFSDFNLYKINKSDQENPVRHDCVIRMTKDNPEITAVLGFHEKDDWRLKASSDVHAVIKLKAPGKILSAWLDPNTPLEISRVENPNFKKRVFSFQFHPYLTEEQWIDMNIAAQKHGFIRSEQRLLAKQDIRTLVNKGYLKRFFDNHSPQDTIIVSAVDKKIMPGNHDELYDYLKTDIQNQLK